MNLWYASKWLQVKRVGAEHHERIWRKYFERAHFCEEHVDRGTLRTQMTEVCGVMLGPTG